MILITTVNGFVNQLIAGGPHIVGQMIHIRGFNGVLYPAFRPRSGDVGSTTGQVSPDSNVLLVYRHIY